MMVKFGGVSNFLLMVNYNNMYTDLALVPTKVTKYKDSSNPPP